MALSSCGIRDTARVLGISPATVINELKKEPDLHTVNHDFLAIHRPDQIAVDIIKAEHCHDVSEQDTTVEMDEIWSYVGSKDNQRWLCPAIDRDTVRCWLVFGPHRDEVLLKLKGLLEPFGITRFYTDNWGTYVRHLDPQKHIIGKQNTQKIERKNLTLRTRIKQLVRKTICFLKLNQMHDIIIGLFVNRYEFGIVV